MDIRFLVKYFGGVRLFYYINLNILWSIQRTIFKHTWVIYNFLGNLVTQQNFLANLDEISLPPISARGVNYAFKIDF